MAEIGGLLVDALLEILDALVLEDLGEDLDLLRGDGHTRDLVLEARVADELDGEVEHEAVGMLLGELVEHVAPHRVLDHLGEPEWHAAALQTEDGVRFARVEVLHDEHAQVVLHRLLHVRDARARQYEPLGEQVDGLRDRRVVVGEQVDDRPGLAAVHEVGLDGVEDARLHDVVRRREHVQALDLRLQVELGRLV